MKDIANMNCETTGGLIPLLLGDGLTEEIQNSVIMHLVTCKDCREELAFWAQIQLAKKSETGEVPKEVTNRVLAAIKEVNRESDPFASTKDAIYLVRKAIKAMI